MGVMASVFGNQEVKARFEIVAHAWVRVLINAKARGGVLDKEMEQPLLRQLAKILKHFPCHQVKAPFLGFQAEFILGNHAQYLYKNYAVVILSLNFTSMWVSGISLETKNILGEDE